KRESRATAQSPAPDPRFRGGDSREETRAMGVQSRPGARADGPHLHSFPAAAMTMSATSLGAFVVVSMSITLAWPGSNTGATALARAASGSDSFIRNRRSGD